MLTRAMMFATLTLGLGCQSETTGSLEQLVSLDPATGIGFVGKGRVQSTFGWNNAALQANAGGLTFSFELDAVYEQSCIHVTGSGHKVVQVTFKKVFELRSDIAFAARRNPNDKITGFHLDGIAAAGPAAPTDLCNPGQSEPDDLWSPDPEGLYPTVTLTSGSADAILYVSYMGERHPLPTSDDDSDAD